MFYVLSQPFLKDIDLKFCTHIHETLPSNICYVFLNFDLGGNCPERKKWTFFWKFWKNGKWKKQGALCPPQRGEG